MSAARAALQYARAQRHLPASSTWELAAAAAYGTELQREATLQPHKDNDEASNAALQVITLCAQHPCSALSSFGRVSLSVLHSGMTVRPVVQADL